MANKIVKELLPLAINGDVGAQYRLGNYYIEKKWFPSRRKANKWYKKAGLNGNAEAQYKLGEYFSKKSTRKAIKWLSLAAEKNHAEAQYLLACCYEKKFRLDLAEELYNKAAENGSAAAQCVLGNKFMAENKKDYETAVKWFIKSAEQGYAAAQERLAYCRYKGLGVKKDASAAIKWYYKAACQGEPAALYAMGRYYEEGNNLAEAFKWYLKGAQAGHPGAMAEAGEYIFRANDVRQTGFSQRDGAVWLKKASDAGDSMGQYWVYLLIMRCVHSAVEFTDIIDLVGNNKNEAWTLLVKSANGGHKDAQYELVEQLISKKNYKDAKDWLDYLIKQGDKRVYSTMGWYYADQNNHSQAFVWYKKAYDAGCTGSAWQMALCYKFGRGVDYDPYKYFYYLKESYDKSNGFEADWLAHCYLKGIGVERDVKKAREYYNIAKKKVIGSSPEWEEVCAYFKFRIF